MGILRDRRVARLTDARVYVRRRGRITRGQARALANDNTRLLPMPETPPDWTTLFGRRAPLLLEIGFGMGDALLATARARPEWNCLGVDVYRPGIGATLLRAEAESLDNVRLIDGDARQVLARAIADDFLCRVHLFFPDPWPKTRHHKRRLVQTEFVHLLAAKLEPGARLHVATDWLPYAEAMLGLLDAEPRLVNAMGRGRFAEGAERSTTRFEERGVGLGHEVFDLVYERVKETR